jgi:hypothetical protein
VFAEITLVGDPSLWIPVSCSVRAGCNTVSAANAYGWADDHETILAFICGLDRTGRDAGRFIALHALSGLEMSSFPEGFISRFYPVSPVSFRHTIFHLAGDHASLTVETPEGVDKHAVLFFLHIDIVSLDRVMLS